MNKSLNVALIVLLVAGCGVRQEQIDAATQDCAPHGGVDLLWGTAKSTTVDVICNDGAEISRKLQSN